MNIIRDIILIVSVLGVMIFGFFIMKRLDEFLEQNRKAIQKERKEIEPFYMTFEPDTDEMVIVKEIDKFKKKHKNAKIIIYDDSETDVFDNIQARIGEKR